ncbi:DUF3995 domain-containing protein [Vibrio wakamikoensis]|jgi:hypothetical protein|uniref:DUF3995 domain-containing protein n=1 Tax=Vibrio chaetopteri TaxID=3016528 RepID=A0AAU8BN02_9VIBR
MQSLVALSMFSILSIIALIHVYWAFGRKKGVQLAIPKLEGSNAFTLGAGVIFLVAICLSLFASLSLGLIELVFIEPELLEYVQWAGIVVGTIFILRAIGDFNLVGFTKKTNRVILPCLRMCSIHRCVYCLARATSIWSGVERRNSEQTKRAHRGSYTSNALQ